MTIIQLLVLKLNIDVRIHPKMMFTNDVIYKVGRLSKNVFAVDVYCYYVDQEGWGQKILMSETSCHLWMGPNCKLKF